MPLTAIGVAPNSAPGAGLSMATVGARVSRSSTGVAVAEPPQLLATRARGTRPSWAPRSKAVKWKEPSPGTTAARPLTVTWLAVPETPARSTVRLPTSEPGAGAVSATTGGTMDTRTSTRVALPAPSVATTSTRPGSAVARLAVVTKAPSASGVTATPLTVSSTEPSPSATDPVTGIAQTSTSCPSTGAVTVSAGGSSSITRRIRAPPDSVTRFASTPPITRAWPESCTSAAGA